MKATETDGGVRAFRLRFRLSTSRRVAAPGFPGRPERVRPHRWRQPAERLHARYNGDMATEREQIRAIERQLDGVIEQSVRQVATAVTRELVDATPRVTGTTAANWTPRIGAPYERAHFRRVDAVVAQTVGVLSLAGYRLRRGAVYVSNALPWITSLNEGGSKRAPAGFVQQAIGRALRRVSQRRRR